MSYHQSLAVVETTHSHQHRNTDMESLDLMDLQNITTEWADIMMDSNDLDLEQSVDLREGALFDLDVTKVIMNETGVPELVLQEMELETITQLPQEGTLIPEDNFRDWNHESFMQSELDCLPLFSPTEQEEEAVNEEVEEEAKMKNNKKRRVGRPLKAEQTAVTVLPTGKVSSGTMREARYRRMRDLNNIASQKCRLRKKEKEMKAEKELEKALKLNSDLNNKVERYQRLQRKLRQTFIHNDIPLPDLKDLAN